MAIESNESKEQREMGERAKRECQLVQQSRRWLTAADGNGRERECALALILFGHFLIEWTVPRVHLQITISMATATAARDRGARKEHTINGARRQSKSSRGKEREQRSECEMREKLARNIIIHGKGVARENEAGKEGEMREQEGKVLLRPVRRPITAKCQRAIRAKSGQERERERENAVQGSRPFCSFDRVKGVIMDV